MSTASYRARWVFPVASPPLEGGVVELTDGVISAIHNKAEPRAVDLGNVAILPGLVNAHTHLEFSDLSAPLEPAEPFTEWIRALVGHRRSRGQTPEAIIAQGFREAMQAGTRAIGEIATDGWSPEVFLKTDNSFVTRSVSEAHVTLTNPDPRLRFGLASEAQPFSDPACQVVVFRELLGLQPERIVEQLAIAKQHLEAGSMEESGRLMRGLSPHAPYSVHPELFHQLVRLGQEHQAPLAMHLAETQAELELLAEGTGEFVEMLSTFGIWQEGWIPRGSRILDYLEPLAEVERGLVIHGNYLSDADISFLAQHPQLTVVYCPRTHAFFRHQNHPWPKLVKAGVRVALGTDSRASNPDLNLWEDVKFLHRKYPQTPPEQWLRWATHNGAIALYGPDTTLGTLQPGQRAVWSVIPLTKPDASEPYSALLP